MLPIKDCANPNSLLGLDDNTLKPYSFSGIYIYKTKRALESKYHKYSEKVKSSPKIREIINEILQNIEFKQNPHGYFEEWKKENPGEYIDRNIGLPVINPIRYKVAKYMDKHLKTANSETINSIDKDLEEKENMQQQTEMYLAEICSEWSKKNSQEIHSLLQESLINWESKTVLSNFETKIMKVLEKIIDETKVK